MKQPQNAQWVRFGEGSFNTTYRSHDGTQVLKKQKHSENPIDNAMDTPARSVRIWRELNPTIAAQTHEQGWTLEFIAGEQATDAQIIPELIRIYQQTERIVIDACGKRNFLSSKAETVCVDVGMAIRRNSNASLAFYFNDPDTQNAYQKYWQKGELRESRPETICTTKALLYLDKNKSEIKPDTFDKFVVQLGFNQTLRSTLAWHHDSNKPLTTMVLNSIQSLLLLRPSTEDITFFQRLNMTPREYYERKNLQAINCLQNFYNKKDTFKQSKHQSIKSFCQMVISNLNEYPNPNLENIIKNAATAYFVHDHAILRALADCVLIPLGIASLGTLFAAKSYLTGACLFSTENTKRANAAFEALRPALVA